MPVLHYYPVIGGFEMWTQNIAERLSEKAEIFVVTGKVKGQPKKENLNRVNVFRTSLFTLKKPYSSLIYILSSLPFVFFKSLILIRNKKVNLLHCQGFLSSFLGFFLSKLTRIPYITTVQRLERKGNPLKTLVYRRAACAIAVSLAVKKYFEEIGAKNIEVIPNGVDLRRFENLNREGSRHKLGLKDEFVIMTVARLEKVKGIKYLIGAMARSDLLGRSHLLIIGDGSERENLESLAEELGLKERVKFLGQISNEKIPEYLAAADCFVLPSLKEGFGIVILEAQAAGIPVIGTRVGGILDIIEDQKTGILVKPKNPKVIAQAISKIYSQPEFAKDLAQNAKANLEKYDWDKIAERVYKVYETPLEDYTTKKASSNWVKIIIATGIFPPDIGGPATYVERLATELSQRGFDIRVITYFDNRAQNYDFPVIRISRKYPGGLRHFIYFLKLLKLAKNCDVIYAQNVTSAGLPALLTAKLLRKKIVLKVVGDAAWEQKKPYLKKIQEYVAKNVHQIITPSQYAKNMVVGWGVLPEKIKVIYNAIEKSSQPDTTKEEAKEKIGISGDIILSIGRLVPWKGFSDLVAVMPNLLQENPNFQLAIVGEGEEISNLKSQISNLGLEDRVILTGKVSHQEIPFYFRAVEVFVLNSEYEGLSHVLLEAMQFGVPVVASDCGGNPELIQNNFNGILTEYNNREQIKEAILKIWKNEDLKNKFIQNSREKLKEFTWENLTEKTLNILKTV